MYIYMFVYLLFIVFVMCEHVLLKHQSVTLPVFIKLTVCDIKFTSLVELCR